MISDSAAFFSAFQGVPLHQLPPLMQPGRAGRRSPPLLPVPCDINGFADPNALELTAPDPGSPRTAVLLGFLPAQLI